MGLRAPADGATVAQIPPSKELRWHRCYDDKLDCARLEVRSFKRFNLETMQRLIISQVPLDWLDPSPDQQIVLAVSRLRASNTKDYKGALFFNPGVSRRYV
jgi:hypothetical protein